MRLLIAGLADPFRSGLLAAAARARLVATVCDVDDAAEILRSEAGTAVLFDPAAAGGGELVERLRSACPEAALVGLAGPCTIEERVQWLGAIDRCIPIGTDPRVVLAEVGALGRRCCAAGQDHVAVGPVVLDMGRSAIEFCGQSMPLTHLEAEMMRLLMSASGSIVPKERIYAHLYGDRQMSSKIIDVVISKLRQKLVRAGISRELIKTIWGQGFIVDEAALTRARELAA